MIISEDTIKGLHSLNGKCFEMNRLWDAAVTVLGVRFVCSQASKLLHEYTAHWYPQLADIINENCLENFNIEAHYPATPIGKTDYENLQDMTTRILEETLDFQNYFIGVSKVADKNDDRQVVVELDKLLRDVNKQVAQIILINDKAMQCGEDYISFDNYFPSFFMLNRDSNVRSV